MEKRKKEIKSNLAQKMKNELKREPGSVITQTKDFFN